MELKGVPQRAREAQSALNRLHWEVQYAVEQGKSVQDVAEALAIAVQIGRLIDEHLPAGDPRRTTFERSLEFMKGYHEQPR